MEKNSSLKFWSAGMENIFWCLLLIFISGFGCETQPVIIQGSSDPSPQYGCIDIPEEYIAAGLGELCQRLSQSLGSVNPEPVIRNYAAQVRQGLYQSGVCSLQKLNINGATVDINVYFLPDRKPPTLRMEAYANGNAEPQAILASHYFINPQ
jgi:hypothetical protein